VAKIVEGRLLRSGVAGAGGLGGSEMRICIIGLVRRRSSGVKGELFRSEDHISGEL
jgi:hypothetical protein